MNTRPNVFEAVSDKGQQEIGTLEEVKGAIAKVEVGQSARSATTFDLAELRKEYQGYAWDMEASGLVPIKFAPWLLKRLGICH